MNEMFVAGAVLDTYTKTPVLVLMDKNGCTALPIGIGESECNSICFAMAGYKAERPQSHDLLLSTIEALGWHVKDVELTEVKSDAYIASIHLIPRDNRMDMELPVDARPSDAIAIAIRAQAPILVADEVIEYGGLKITKENEDPEFHSFVQNTNASDFNRWFTSHG